MPIIPQPSGFAKEPMSRGRWTVSPPSTGGLPHPRRARGGPPRDFSVFSAKRPGQAARTWGSMIGRKGAVEGVRRALTAYNRELNGAGELYLWRHRFAVAVVRRSTAKIRCAVGANSLPRRQRDGRLPGSLPSSASLAWCVAQPRSPCSAGCCTNRRNNRPSLPDTLPLSRPQPLKPRRSKSPLPWSRPRPLPLPPCRRPGPPRPRPSR